MCLLGLAGVAAGGSDSAGAVRAARLGGAAEGLLDTLGGVLEPPYRALDAELRRALPARLGAPAFATEWAAGRVMPLEQAIAVALGREGEDEDGHPVDSAPPRDPRTVLP